MRRRSGGRRRANASSSRTMRVARPHSPSIAAARSRAVSGSAALVRSSCADIRIVDSGLLSSCATPDSSVPSALSLSAWIS